jgi:hypothetical protein
MKKILTILIITFFTVNLLVAQKDPIVVSGGYSKIYKGKEASFEKAVANHVTKWHGPDQWPTFAAKVMTGPRSGQYLMGTSNHYWKDYADRKSIKAHDDEWKNLVNKHVEEQEGMTFFEKQLDASYNDRAAPMWEAVAYYTKPGKRGTMLEILRKGAVASRNAKYKGSMGVYNQISGGEQNGILLVIYRMDSMADMALQSPTVKERWVKQYGEKVFEQAVKDWYDSYTKSQSEILELIPEMSTPSSN